MPGTFTFPLGIPKLAADATSAAYKEWTVPTGKKWLVTGASSRNSSAASNMQVTFTSGAVSIVYSYADTTTPATTSTAYLRMLLNQTITAGEKVRITNTVFSGGDTVNYAIQYLEVDA